MNEGIRFGSGGRVGEIWGTVLNCTLPPLFGRSSLLIFSGFSDIIDDDENNVGAK